jgi:all-trans-retinol dehydrogenase (NAD+)
MTDLARKYVLITGAAGGLGRLMARQIARLDSHLILWDIDEQGLRSINNELERVAASVATYHCDLSDRSAIAAAARSVMDECGPLDVLVNNAGVVAGKSFCRESEEEIERTFAVNALAPVRITHAFLPGMLERNRGHIVNISSAAGIVGSARLVDYCASKSALFGFDEALRIDLRRLGSAVRTTVVCPYYVDTGMFRGATTRFPWLLPILDPERVADRIVRAIERDHRRVILPWFLYTGWPLRLLPVPLFDLLIDFFGISRSLDHFTGGADGNSTRFRV